MRVGTSQPCTRTQAVRWDHPHACGDKQFFDFVAVATLRIIPMRVGTSCEQYQHQKLW